MKGTKNSNFKKDDINITNKCIDIINSNTPEKSIDLIANIKSPLDNVKYGKKSALKIYKILCNKAINYSSEKYQNNIIEYQNEINDSINRASLYVYGK
jgi:hypothetical protein